MASLTDAKRLVVKIGSALLVDADAGILRKEWLKSLAEDVARIKARGTDVVLVSSGSIALGRRILGLPSGALALEQAQAAAAVGQIQLARAYEEAMAAHGILTAQVLVTLEDSADRRRYLNSRMTLQTLLALGTVPIVNENDTVATDEIRFGDNDRLAAQVAVTIEADQMVLLSDVDGFYSGNPATDPNAKRFDVVGTITPEIEAMAGDPVSGLSKGGMKTKLMAAKTATTSGCGMAIAEGFGDAPLLRIEKGGPVTWFTPQIDPHAARKRWISAMKPIGSIHIDEGAADALASGKSLLPAGAVSISGDFGRGEPVAIVNAQGHVIGQGLCRYTAKEASKITGARSAQVNEILGSSARSAMIHRDDMALS